MTKKERREMIKDMVYRNMDIMTLQEITESCEWFLTRQANTLKDTTLKRNYNLTLKKWCNYPKIDV